MPVLQALLYLRLTMVRNLLSGFVKRLRQPRYLLGLCMAAAYFWLIIFRRMPARPGSGAVTIPDDVIALFVSGLVSIVVLSMWVLAGDKPNLRFTEAEVAFLFPAPIKRSQLIHYKLLTGFMSSLLGAVFFLLVSLRFTSGLDMSLRYTVGWWLLLSLLGLHNTAAGFTVVRIGTGKLITSMRRVAMTGLTLLFLVGAIYLSVTKKTDALHMLLAPGQVLVQPFFVSGVAYVEAMAVMVVVLLVHYLWVLKLETPFEEASMAKAASRAELVEKIRSGKSMNLTGKAKARREPFKLRPQMPVELVLLWKNLMLVRPYVNRRVFVASVLIIIFGMRWLHAQHTYATQAFAGMLGSIGLLVIAYTLLLGPQLVRLDLRNDLAQADLLKSWPVPGWRIVLGNLSAPTLVMTGVCWLMLLTAATGISGSEKFMPWLTDSLKISLAVSIAVYLPALVALMLLGPNAVALYFPAWSQMGAPSQRGLDAMGLRMLLGIGQLLLLALMLLPALLMAALIMFFSQWFTTQEVGVVLATAGSLVVVVLEILFGVHLLGERFEQLDIGAELRQ